MIFIGHFLPECILLRLVVNLQPLVRQRGKCTSVLVETEKNAHSQSNAVSFAVTIFLPGLTGSELRLFKNLTQSED